MPQPPTDDQPGFVAEEPEHCHDCLRLLRRGQRNFLTVEQLALCPDRIAATDAIRLAGGRTVEVGEDRLVARRGSVAAGEGGRNGVS